MYIVHESCTRNFTFSDAHLRILQMLNDSLKPVATIILLSNFKAASVQIEESLWPSQKAIILGTGVLMIWELVK